MGYYLDNASSYSDGPDAYLGNPHSLHGLGMKTQAMIRDTERQLLEKINGNHGYLIWTGSGSEANRLAIETCCRQGGLITTDIEHKSIWDHRRRYGWACPVSPQGLVEADRISKFLHQEISMLSVMHVNNELGTIQPIQSLVGLARARAPEALVHCDMAQSLCKLPIDLLAMDLDMATFSSHKVGGPKGLGCLWVNNRVKTAFPYLGTPDPRSISYFGLALEMFHTNNEKVSQLEQTLLTYIKEEIRLNVERNEYRLPGVLSICIPGVDATDLMLALSDRHVYISTTSACNNLKQQRSHVLEAIGLSPETIDSTIRISLCSQQSDEHIKQAAMIIDETIKELKDGPQSKQD